ncbi:hypothetical protein B0H34DRAFT_801176 [Crassisporium funariophilum]|nr:hypothetical protein B0H34DRAFT_801176 [Crassisporium funariophilum]
MFSPHSPCPSLSWSLQLPPCRPTPVLTALTHSHVIPRIVVNVDRLHFTAHQTPELLYLKTALVDEFGLRGSTGDLGARFNAPGSAHVEEVVVKRVIERYTGCRRRRRGVRWCGIRAGMGRLWLVRPSSSPAGLHSSRTQHEAADPNDWVMTHPQQRQWPASLSQEKRRWTATELSGAAALSTRAPFLLLLMITAAADHV